MRKRLFIFSGSIAIVFIAYLFFPSRQVGCVLDLEKVVLSTVHSGKFVEPIPFSARIVNDSSVQKIVGELDALYFSRVSLDSKASTFLNGIEYTFEITHKDTVLQEGRFHVTLSSVDPALKLVRQNELLRMRLILSEVENSVQLNVGGFYKDTGGKYVFVVLPNMKVIKRSVILGKKNPECFQVLAGLAVGDVVITSSYENFRGRDDLDLESIRDLVD